MIILWLWIVQGQNVGFGSGPNKMIAEQEAAHQFIKLFFPEEYRELGGK